MTSLSSSTMSCGGNHAVRRRSRRVSRPGPSAPCPLLSALCPSPSALRKAERLPVHASVNSSAHKPLSEESASMSPSGVDKTARRRSISDDPLDQVPHDRFLLLDQLHD